MNKKLQILNRKIIKCNKCKRLVNFRKKIAKNKRKKYFDQEYWCKPITGFGDQSGKILFVGLAPAAHGGTRTGRVFTGDKSSDFLYKCLFKAKISNQSNSEHIKDGMNLNNDKLFPFFEAASELGASIFIHPWDMLGTDEIKQYWLPWLVGMPAETSRAICSLIFGGVFEKLPNLKIAIEYKQIHL